METQLTHFIGLACYHAGLLGREGLPQGALEKIIVVATRERRLQIEGVEKTYRPRGEQIQYRPSSLLIESTIGLERIRSSYFQRQEDSGQRVYAVTEKFTRELPTLFKKEYLAGYEAWIMPLVKCWSLDGGIENLLFLSLISSSDQGIKAMVADLEYMSGLSADIIWANILEKNKARRKASSISDEFNNLYDAIRQKIRVLREVDVFVARLRSLSLSAVVASMADEASRLPRINHLWTIVEWLADIWKSVVNILLQWPIEAGLLFAADVQSDRSNIAEKIKSVVDGFGDKLGLPRVAVGQSIGVQDQIDTYIQKLSIFMEAIFRALVAEFDSRYFRAHEPGFDMHQIGRYIVYLDIRKSTSAIAKANADKALVGEYGVWFESICAIAKNWAIAFGGRVSSVREEAGDKIKCYFDRSMPALQAMGLILTHLEMIESAQGDSASFHFEARAGIGQSDAVIVAGGQEHSPVISYFAHEISKLADEKILPGQSALALEGFVSDTQCIQYVEGTKRQIKEADACAYLISYSKVVAEFLRLACTATSVS